MKKYFDEQLIRIGGKCRKKRIHFQGFADLGYDLSNAIFFDDMPHNIQAIKSMGVHAILVQVLQFLKLTLVRGLQGTVHFFLIFQKYG